jgi:exodeoxyribonuclease V gamma subunit
VLTIHRSERSDALVAALGQVLREPGGDPFQPEIVAVPSRGVERWLAQQLSHVLGAAPGQDDGVCANVLFPSYTRVLDDAVAEADEDYRSAVELWTPERAVWALIRVIDECAPRESWCSVLATHLGLDARAVGPPRAGRRFAVASKLARLFDRYGRSRPAMINAWAAGRDEQGDASPLPDDLRWQAELWRRVRAEIAHPSPAELLERACGRIAAGPAFSIFGATRISPARVSVLRALSAKRDVHLWLHHPSPALWAATKFEAPGPRWAQQPNVTNPLLASLSRDVRELQQLLNDVPHHDAYHPVAARPATLLGRLQQQLAGDEPAQGSAQPDGSLQVHAAHGPARQVEVLRETVLGLLAADPTLEPRDILIMCPDVEAYAPLVAASFGMPDEPGGHPAAKLRVKLADRSLRQTNPLLGLLSQLLTLANSRVTATQLLDLAGASPVRRAFGFDDDDIERLRDWTVKVNARWGLDADHRSAYQMRGIADGTWQQAVDRLLLGVAMEDDECWVGDTLPLDDVDSADIDLAGRFAELVDRVHETVRLFGAARGVADWAEVLKEVTLGLGEAEQPWQAMQLRNELDDVAASAADTDVHLALADVTAMLQAQLAGRPTRANFRTGSLTVCTLVPMRSVPHRVICLLGMDDGIFPRHAIADGDDVLAREPRSGERDPRSEDRQLFLDAICAAQEHLVITYTGADPRSGAEVPPCVPLGELLDALHASIGGSARERVVVHHPLQPFDPRNFAASRPFSFDQLALAGARATTQPRVEPPPLLSAPLPPRAADVALDDLVRFLQHPARGFLRQRLDISTGFDEDEPADAVTVELDGLQGWAIGERVLQSCVSGTSREVAARLERMRGELPPGPLGQRELITIGGRVDALLGASAAERRHDATAVDVAVTLPGGRVLAGTVSGVRGSTLLAVTYSTLAPKHRLTAWLRYLALVAAGHGDDTCAVTVGRERDGAKRAVLRGVSQEVAVRLLDLLVRIRDAGLREPLPMALQTSERYAARRRAGVSVANAEVTACHQWETDRFRPERDEPEHVLVWGAHAPFDVLTAAPVTDADEQFPGETTRFGSLARLVWECLLEVETEERT